jgi:hypothetical protein
MTQTRKRLRRSAADKGVQATKQKSSKKMSSATKTSTKQGASLEERSPRLPKWAWRKRSVDPSEDHFELRYGSAEDSGWENWIPVARVGRPIERAFRVDFILNHTVPNFKAIMDTMVKELDFYLVELHERDPWRYAQYHCGTTANVYSSVHWSFCPKRTLATSPRRGKPTLPLQQET